MKEFTLKAIRYTLIVTAIIGIMIIPAEDSAHWTAMFLTSKAVAALAWAAAMQSSLWKDTTDMQST